MSRFKSNRPRKGIQVETGRVSGAPGVGRAHTPSAMAEESTRAVVENAARVEARIEAADGRAALGSVGVRPVSGGKAEGEIARIGTETGAIREIGRAPRSEGCGPARVPAVTLALRPTPAARDAAVARRVAWLAGQRADVAEALGRSAAEAMASGDVGALQAMLADPRFAPGGIVDSAESAADLARLDARPDHARFVGATETTRTTYRSPGELTRPGGMGTAPRLAPIGRAPRK